MGPGHLVIAMAAKPAAPKVPLWVLLAASEMLDLLSFLFLAIGIEKPGTSSTDLVNGVKAITPSEIPWSHGLFMSIVWSLLAAVIVWLFLHDRRSSIIVGLVVLSHWVLDLIVHLPDLPLLFNGSPKVGLGLWSTGPGLILDCTLEVVLFACGIVLYLAVRKRKKV